MNNHIDEGLKRVVGVTGLAATIINNTIGAGIYALPAIVGIQMGAAGITGYLFCGLMLAAIMLCYVEVGSCINTSGGSYAYVESAFGSFAGFLINWIFFFGYGIMSSAAVMNILADSLTLLFPVFSNSLIRAVLFFILLGTLALVNVFGAKESVHFVKFITIIKLLPLLGIIIFGFSHIDPDNLHWGRLPTISKLGETSLVLFFAFGGFETSMCVSGEIKNPKRTIPYGVMLSGISVLIIYMLIQTVAQGVLGSQMAAFKNAPLAAVAEKIVGPVGATILLMATIISCFGNTSGDVLGSPRLLFAGANKGMFPKFLSKVHPRFATPYWAIITYTLLIFIFSVSGGFRQLAILSSAALLIIYLAAILAMIKLRVKKKNEIEKSFKVPGGLIIPFIGIASIVWLLSHLSSIEIISMIVFISVLSILYFVLKMTRKK